MDSTAPPLDRNLYCLKCGYNLRGLTGELIRCPECGFDNPIGDVEMPAEIIDATLKRMETAPAAAVGIVIFLVPMQLIFWNVLAQELFIQGHVDAGALACTGIPSLSLAIGWVVAIARFRDCCRAKPGWVSTLLRYHVVGLGLATLVAGAILGGMYGINEVQPRRSSDWNLLFLGVSVLGLVAGVFLAIVFGLRGVHRWLTAPMHTLQREVAVAIARETSRRKLARKR